MHEGGGMLGLNPGLRDHPLQGFPGFGGLGLGPGGGGPVHMPHPNSAPNMWPFIWSHITNLLPQLSINRMDPLSQVFSLKWNNHRTNMINVMERLLNSEMFCDVTIACEGGSIKCHKIVLSASSVYFEKLFLENTCEHPIVFLKDVKEQQMKAIIEYMYRGDVSISQDELPALLRVAELLKVKGMMEERRECKDLSRPKTSSPAPTPPSSTPTTSPRAERLSHPPTSHPIHTPTSIPQGHMGHNFRPFLTPPGQGSTPPFPMWPLPGLFPTPHNMFSQREDMKPLSPGPKDRTKVSSGGSAEKDISSLPPSVPREGIDEKNCYERQCGSPDERMYDKSPKPSPFGHGGIGKLEGIAGYVPTQRLEWKRYKQYTRSDIMAAIEEVKKGKSALQVSKKFNIPSRTLYDKVKKMGITTGRQQQRKSMGGTFNAYSAAFPGLNMMSPLSRLDGLNMDNPYKDLMDRMKEARDEEEREGREGEGSTHPPFNILSPHMLNMMERMKGEGETSPMNLSSERDEKPRVSEGSIPQSPSPSSAELTSPSNPQTSPGEYNPTSDHRSHSPPPIDIHAQFLAGLRHLGDHRPSSPIEAEHSRAGYTSPQDNLPPRKRKVSQDHDRSKMLSLHEKMASLPEKMADMNGLHEGDRNMAPVN